MDLLKESIIKVIKKTAFGYKSFKLFRSKILYIFNGKISKVTKIKITSKKENNGFHFLLQALFLK